MPNLSFWRNSKAKENNGSKANLSVISVTFVVVSLEEEVTSNNNISLISSFISHSLSHFFSKMSLAHTCRCSPTPCFWAVIGLLDSSLPSSISF